MENVKRTAGLRYEGVDTFIQMVMNEQAKRGIINPHMTKILRALVTECVERGIETVDAAYLEARYKECSLEQLCNFLTLEIAFQEAKQREMEERAKVDQEEVDRVMESCIIKTDFAKESANSDEVKTPEFREDKDEVAQTYVNIDLLPRAIRRSPKRSKQVKKSFNLKKTVLVSLTAVALFVFAVLAGAFMAKIDHNFNNPKKQVVKLPDVPVSVPVKEEPLKEVPVVEEVITQPVINDSHAHVIVRDEDLRLPTWMGNFGDVVVVKQSTVFNDNFTNGITTVLLHDNVRNIDFVTEVVRNEIYRVSCIYNVRR